VSGEGVVHIYCNEKEVMITYIYLYLLHVPDESTIVEEHFSADLNRDYQH